jgi:hypothetical protein
MGKILVSKRKAVSWAIVALAVGAVLVALGAVVISVSGPEKVVLWHGGALIPEEPFPTVYAFNVAQLVTGFILTLAGTAMASVSLTYLLLERMRKGV